MHGSFDSWSNISISDGNNQLPSTANSVYHLRSDCSMVIAVPRKRPQAKWQRAK